MSGVFPSTLRTKASTAQDAVSKSMAALVQSGAVKITTPPAAKFVSDNTAAVVLTGEDKTAVLVGSLVDYVAMLNDVPISSLDPHEGAFSAENKIHAFFYQLASALGLRKLLFPMPPGNKLIRAVVEEQRLAPKRKILAEADLIDEFAQLLDPDKFDPDAFAADPNDKEIVETVQELARNFQKGRDFDDMMMLLMSLELAYDAISTGTENFLGEERFTVGAAALVLTAAFTSRKELRGLRFALSAASLPRVRLEKTLKKALEIGQKNLSPEEYDYLESFTNVLSSAAEEAWNFEADIPFFGEPLQDFPERDMELFVPTIAAPRDFRAAGASSSTLSTGIYSSLGNYSETYPVRGPAKKRLSAFLRSRFGRARGEDSFPLSTILHRMIVSLKIFTARSYALADATIDDKDAEIQTLLARVADATDEKKKATEELNEARKELDTVKEELEEKSETIEEQADKIKEANDKLREAVQRHQEQMQELAKQRELERQGGGAQAASQAEVTKLREERNEAIRIAEEFDRKLEEEKQRRERLEEELQHKEEQLRTRNMELDTMKEELGKVKAAGGAGRQAELEKLEKENRNLKEVVGMTAKATPDKSSSTLRTAAPRSPRVSPNDISPADTLSETWGLKEEDFDWD